MRDCGILTAATVVLWLVLARPAWLLGGPAGLEGVTYAAVLCLLPGWLVFFIASRYRVATARAMAILAGTVFRLLFVLIGVLVLTAVREGLGFREFLVWLIVFYLTTLCIETWLIVRRMAS